MTTEKTVSICMSETAPIRVKEADWPKVAFTEAWDGQHKSQAFRGASISVREHKDGRRIVYGNFWTSYSGEADYSAGFLVPAKDGKPDDEATVRTIRRVDGIVGFRYAGLAQDCIDRLPERDFV